MIRLMPFASTRPPLPSCPRSIPPSTLCGPSLLSPQTPSLTPTPTPTPTHRARRRRHRHRHRTRTPTLASAASSALAAGVLAIVAAVPQLASASSNDLPPLDFDQLGDAALVGPFAGLELWTPPSPHSVNGSSALLARAPNGTLSPLAHTDAGGSIDVLCEMPGLPEQPASLYAAGNFTSIEGVRAANIARWQPQDGAQGSWHNLGPGIPGPAQALFCDPGHSTVVAGGNFTNSISIWNITSMTWLDQPALQLDAPVLTLRPGTSPATTQIAGGFSIHLSSPGAGGNRSASPITSALNPVSMAGTTIRASAVGSGDPADLLCPQANDGASGGTFLWPDGTSGSVTISFYRPTRARAIRLGNTFANGRSSGNFSLTTSASGEPVSLVYADISTGLNATCDSACPLSTNPTIPYQDFIFSEAENSVEGTMNLNSLTITVDSWVGQGPGLHLLQVLGPGASAHANRGYNRGVCQSDQPGAGSFTGSVSIAGGWHHSAYGSGANSTEGYLSLQRFADSNGSIKFNLRPHVEGNYTLFVAIPGCTNTGTCGSGGAFSASIEFNSTQPAVQTTIAAPGPDDQSIAVYDGPVAQATERWLPSVTLTLDTPPSGSSVTGAVVRVDAVLRNSSALPPAAVPAFGLLETNLYASLPNRSVAGNVTTSILNAAAAGLAGTGLKPPSYVAAYAVAGNQVLVGGSFRGKTIANATSDAKIFTNLVVMVPPANASAQDAARYEALVMPGGGLNGPVTSLHTIPVGILVGGNFSATADGQTKLSNVAHFNVTAGRWDALDGGLPGPVSAIESLGADGIMFMGAFPLSSTGGASGLTTGSYAIWNITTKSWTYQHALVEGSLRTALYPNSAYPTGFNQTTYLAGQVDEVAAQSAPGAISLGSVPANGIYPVLRPLNFSLQNTFSSEVQKAQVASKPDYATVLARWTATLKGSVKFPSAGPDAQTNVADIVSRADLSSTSSSASKSSGMYAATFWPSPQGQWMIMGGQFVSGNATNVGMYLLSNSSGSSSGSGDDSESDSDNLGGVQKGFLKGMTQYPDGQLGTVHALTVVNDTLYVGSTGGLDMYNLETESWESSVPPLAASGSKAIVRQILLRPDTNTLIVAGEFDTAGSLPCGGICRLDTMQRRWSQVPGLTGNVTDVSFAEVRRCSEREHDPMC